MELQMFLEFPGVLITVGVALLLISIIIIIIAYKSNSKEVDASKLSVNQVHYDSNVYQDGYDNRGKPKMTIESNAVSNSLDKTKVFKTINKDVAMNNNNFGNQRPIGIKDQLERYETKKSNDNVKNQNVAGKIKEPVVDVFEEEFSSKPDVNGFSSPIDDSKDIKVNTKVDNVKKLESAVDDTSNEEDDIELL